MAQVAVIGGGPGGVSCALWLKRLGVEPVLYERHSIGGQLHDITLPIPDLPGEPWIEARELIARLKQHLFTWKISVFEGREALEYRDDRVLVFRDGQEIHYPLVAYAPGLKVRQLNIPGREWIAKKSTTEMLQEPVSHPILVVGGGDRAFEAAIRFAESGRPVTLIHRREGFRARPEFQRRALELGIPIRVNAQLRAVEHGSPGLTAHIEESGKITSIRLSAVMVRIGMEPDIQPGLCSVPQSDVVPLWAHSRVRCLGDAVSPVAFRSIVSAYASGMAAAKELAMNFKCEA
ncbi:MAG: NAD(P)/FAD-dependent oxidoreductase [Firmicutes bacterium]|jgi:thioredoxin reductase (NADPH)|nr:NAD(P)/FAD-dependent oxidoreductase [Bacillota bacterium]